jgi:hypothetical protein
MHQINVQVFLSLCKCAKRKSQMVMLNNLNITSPYGSTEISDICYKKYHNSLVIM